MKVVPAPVDVHLSFEAIFSYNGEDAAIPIRTGVLPKFRLISMPKNHFFLSVALTVDGEIQHGDAGPIKMIVVGGEEQAEVMMAGAKLLVYGSPSLQIGEAELTEITVLRRSRNGVLIT